VLLKAQTLKLCTSQSSNTNPTQIRHKSVNTTSKLDRTTSSDTFSSRTDVRILSAIVRTYCTTKKQFTAIQNVPSNKNRLPTASRQGLQHETDRTVRCRRFTNGFLTDPTFRNQFNAIEWDHYYKLQKIWNTLCIGYQSIVFLTRG